MDLRKERRSDEEEGKACEERRNEEKYEKEGELCESGRIKRKCEKRGKERDSRERCGRGMEGKQKDGGKVRQTMEREVQCGNGTRGGVEVADVQKGRESE